MLKQWSVTLKPLRTRLAIKPPSVGCEGQKTNSFNNKNKTIYFSNLLTTSTAPTTHADNNNDDRSTETRVLQKLTSKPNAASSRPRRRVIVPEIIMAYPFLTESYEVLGFEKNLRVVLKNPKLSVSSSAELVDKVIIELTKCHTPARNGFIQGLIRRSASIPFMLYPLQRVLGSILNLPLSATDQLKSSDAKASLIADIRNIIRYKQLDILLNEHYTFSRYEYIKIVPAKDIPDFTSSFVAQFENQFSISGAKFIQDLVSKPHMVEHMKGMIEKGDGNSRTKLTKLIGKHCQEFATGGKTLPLFMAIFRSISRMNTDDPFKEQLMLAINELLQSMFQNSEKLRESVNGALLFKIPLEINDEIFKELFLSIAKENNFKLSLKTVDKKPVESSTEDLLRKLNKEGKLYVQQYFKKKEAMKNMTSMFDDADIKLKVDMIKLFRKHPTQFMIANGSVDLFRIVFQSISQDNTNEAEEAGLRTELEKLVAIMIRDARILAGNKNGKLLLPLLSDVNDKSLYRFVQAKVVDTFSGLVRHRATSNLLLDLAKNDPSPEMLEKLVDDCVLEFEKSGEGFSLNLLLTAVLSANKFPEISQRSKKKFEDFFANNAAVFGSTGSGRYVLYQTFSVFDPEPTAKIFETLLDHLPHIIANEVGVSAGDRKKLFGWMKEMFLERTGCPKHVRENFIKYVLENIDIFINENSYSEGLYDILKISLEASFWRKHELKINHFLEPLIFDDGKQTLKQILSFNESLALDGLIYLLTPQTEFLTTPDAEEKYFDQVKKISSIILSLAREIDSDSEAIGNRKMLGRKITQIIKFTARSWPRDCADEFVEEISFAEIYENDSGVTKDLVEVLYQNCTATKRTELLELFPFLESVKVNEA